MNAPLGFANRLEKDRSAIHEARMTRPLTALARFCRRHALLPLLAGAILTVLAPFGTSTFDLIPRAAFWLGMTLAGGGGAYLARRWVERLMPGAAVWIIVVATSVGATLAVSPFVLSVFADQSLGGYLLSLFYIWVISITISAVGWLMDRPPNAPTDTAVRPALMERLPLPMRDAALFGVVSEDHYVRVHTSAGEHMLLMRLADVESLASPVTGLSPHRSWWVARDGVADIQKVGSKIELHLHDGTRVPVSRAGAARLREAGWLN